jgi:predicted amidohydrolase YtcJ
MRRFNAKLIVFAALFAVTFLASALRAQTSSPDLILFNGKIITVDQRFSVAQAVAIRGDRIVAVGTSQQISGLAGSNTKKIDLKGKAVIPGLIDNHMHLLRAGTTWARELRLDGVESRKQVLEMISARAKTVGPGEWVYTIGGWAHQQFADDSRPFTRDELDKAAPNNPVALQESYYQTFLNTPGMRALGIKENEADPTDLLKGSIQRDAAGNPIGLIGKDMPAVRPVAAKLPKVTSE